MLPQPRRRWAFFPRSVVSDHENPAAHLYRAMARKVASLDDEARFYEERANPWLRNMLVQDGARAFLTFQERHPEVSYVTYDRRNGHRLAEWLSLALATVDIAVVDPAAPETIVRWIGELTRPRLHTFLLDPDGELVNASELPDYASWYRGVCVNRAGAESLPLETSQQLITFGPATSATAHNGAADAHVDMTAEHLVQQVVRVVDDATAGDSRDPSSRNGQAGR